MSRPARGALPFAACVALLAGGCGDRTGLVDYTSLGTVSGSSSVGVTVGSASGGTPFAPGSSAGVASEAASGSTFVVMSGASSGVLTVTGAPNGSGGTVSSGVTSASGTSESGDSATPCGSNFHNFTMPCPPGLTCQGAPIISNQGSLCSCTCGPCAAGTTACPGGFLGDTCENLQNDPNNCGGCGLVCPGSAPTCVDGSCQNGGNPPSLMPNDADADVPCSELAAGALVCPVGEPTPAGLTAQPLPVACLNGPAGLSVPMVPLISMAGGYAASCSWSFSCADGEPWLCVCQTDGSWSCGPPCESVPGAFCILDGGGLSCPGRMSTELTCASVEYSCCLTTMR
jgi:hypothetical protein